MKNDAFQYQLLKKIFTIDDVFFRIGELSSMTGVSTRQLRYWEQKKYISSMKREDEQEARMYNFYEYAKVTGIKTFLDQGCTLSVAVKNTNEYIEMAKLIHKFVDKSVKGICTHENNLQIDLGWFDETKKEKLIAVEKENGFSYKLIKD